jgi:predicted metal-dependent phosphoesterase TrpH
MSIDFHIHSHHSDGVLSVQEIIELALDRGLKKISITDHDTMDAYKDISRQVLNELTMVPGCEFSSVWKGRTIHIVGLNLDTSTDAMQLAMETQKSAREQRSIRIAEKLEAKGMPDTLAGACRYAKGGVLGRPHFASYLVEKGYAKDSRQAFKKYLGDGKPGDVKTQWRPIEEVVSWIEHSQGVAVLAHPLKYSMTRTRLNDLVKDFISAGGRAIEVISGKQTSVQTQELSRLAKHYDLLASAGSDFHRPGQSWADLGIVQPLPEICKPVWSLWE